MTNLLSAPCGSLTSIRVVSKHQIATKQVHYTRNRYPYGAIGKTNRTHIDSELLSCIVFFCCLCSVGLSNDEVFIPGMILSSTEYLNRIIMLDGISFCCCFFLSWTMMTINQVHHPLCDVDGVCRNVWLVCLVCHPLRFIPLAYLYM